MPSIHMLLKLVFVLTFWFSGPCIEFPFVAVWFLVTTCSMMHMDSKARFAKLWQLKVAALLSFLVDR